MKSLVLISFTSLILWANPSKADSLNYSADVLKYRIHMQQLEIHQSAIYKQTTSLCKNPTVTHFLLSSFAKDSVTHYVFEFPMPTEIISYFNELFHNDLLSPGVRKLIDSEAFNVAVNDCFPNEKSIIDRTNRILFRVGIVESDRIVMQTAGAVFAAVGITLASDSAVSVLAWRIINLAVYNTLRFGRQISQLPMRWFGVTTGSTLSKTIKWSLGVVTTSLVYIEGKRDGAKEQVQQFEALKQEEQEAKCKADPKCGKLVAEMEQRISDGDREATEQVIVEIRNSIASYDRVLAYIDEERKKPNPNLDDLLRNEKIINKRKDRAIINLKERQQALLEMGPPSH